MTRHDAGHGSAAVCASRAKQRVRAKSSRAHSFSKKRANVKKRSDALSVDRYFRMRHCTCLKLRMQHCYNIVEAHVRWLWNPSKGHDVASVRSKKFLLNNCVSYRSMK